MDNSVIAIIVVLYSAWAIYSGWKVITGRSAWLDTKAPVNVIVKILLSVFIGYVIGVFYLIYLILKLIFHF
mgnify:CR=1 FL=1